VLVRSAFQFWYVWAQQLQRYSDRYRCVALDMRGYNDSDKPVGVANYDLDILADDVRQVVAALGYRTCTVVAHDWGGVVAWHVAALYPEILDKLVVVNAPLAKLWTRNVYYYPQLFMVSTPSTPGSTSRSALTTRGRCFGRGGRSRRTYSFFRCGVWPSGSSATTTTMPSAPSSRTTPRRRQSAISTVRELKRWTTTKRASTLTLCLPVVGDILRRSHRQAGGAHVHD